MDIPTEEKCLGHNPEAGLVVLNILGQVFFPSKAGLVMTLWEILPRRTKVIKACRPPTMGPRLRVAKALPKPSPKFIQVLRALAWFNATFLRYFHVTRQPWFGCVVR